MNRRSFFGNIGAGLLGLLCAPFVSPRKALPAAVPRSLGTSMSPPPTLLELARSSQNPFSAAVLKNLVTADEMLPLLPFVPEQGMGFTYTRDAGLDAFEFLADAAGSSPSLTHSQRACADFYVKAAAEEFTAEHRKQAVKKLRGLHDRAEQIARALEAGEITADLAGQELDAIALEGARVMQPFKAA